MAVSDAERATIAVLVIEGLFVVRYLVGVWRMGEPWRMHLGTLVFSIGFVIVLAGALLLGPPAVGLFGLPALLVVGGVVWLRQAPPETRPWPGLRSWQALAEYSSTCSALRYSAPSRLRARPGRPSAPGGFGPDSASP
jgi:hypothetical protein